MTALPPFRTALIFGGGGGVGSLICEGLAEAGIDHIIAADIKYEGSSETNNAGPVNRIAADVCELNSVTEALVATADLIVLAVPYRVAISNAPKILSIIQKGTLLVDTLSVKSEYLSMIEQCNAAAEILSINPMFAPNLGFSGQSVFLIDVTEGPKAREFEALLQSWGSHITKVSADQHDRYTASLQAATHAAILGFGMTLTKMGYDSAELALTCPPPHHAMLAMLARIVAGEPQTYLEIQRENPYAKEARHRLIDSVGELDQAAEIGSDRQFVDIATGIRELLGSEQEDLATVCQRLFECVRRSGSSQNNNKS